MFLRETYAHTILERKASKLRKSTGNDQLRSVFDTGHSPRSRFAVAIVRPSKMLIFAPHISLLSLYMFLDYGSFYLVFTAMSSVYAGRYGFSTGSVGLTYIGLGVGSFFAAMVSGTVSDRLAQHLKSKSGGDHKPEYRLPLAVLASFTIPMGLFIFGWTAEQRQHWILPTIGSSIISFGATLSSVSTDDPLITHVLTNYNQMTISTYLIDTYGVYAASAVAASTVLRSLGGALLPLAGGPLFSTLGLSWGSSLLAFLAVAIIPVPVLFIKYGEIIRQKRLFNITVE
jgi:MFS family permease